MQCQSKAFGKPSPRTGLAWAKDVNSLKRIGAFTALALFLFLPPNSGIAAAVEPPDPFEDDDTYATASYIGVSGFDQTHTTHDDGDVDWVYFSVEGDKILEIETLNLGPEADTYIALYDSELNLIEEDDDGSVCLYCSAITRGAAEGEPPLPTGLYFLEVRTSSTAVVTGFGPDTEYDLRIATPEAPCVQGCTTTLSGKVTDPITQEIVDANVEIIRNLGVSDSYSIRDDLFTDSEGVYVICDVDANEAEPATPYLVKITAPGFPMHVGAVSILKCQDTLLNLTLNKDNLAVAEIDFSRSKFQAQDGSATARYQRLLQGVLAAQASGIINLQPGSTTETFTGGGEITKAVQLVNANPGGGPVIIGAPAARRTGQGRPEAKAGFVSRP